MVLRILAFSLHCDFELGYVCVYIKVYLYICITYTLDNIYSRYLQNYNQNDRWTVELLLESLKTKLNLNYNF